MKQGNLNQSLLFQISCISYKTAVLTSEFHTSILEGCLQKSSDDNGLYSLLLSFIGRQRSRMLATLFKDERCQQLPAHEILEKM